MGGWSNNLTDGGGTEWLVNDAPVVPGGAFCGGKHTWKKPLLTLTGLPCASNAMLPSAGSGCCGGFAFGSGTHVVLSSVMKKSL